MALTRVLQRRVCEPVDHVTRSHDQELGHGQNSPEFRLLHPASCTPPPGSWCQKCWGRTAGLNSRLIPSLSSRGQESDSAAASETARENAVHPSPSCRWLLAFFGLLGCRSSSPSLPLFLQAVLPVLPSVSKHPLFVRTPVGRDYGPP